MSARRFRARSEADSFAAECHSRGYTEVVATRDATVPGWPWLVSAPAYLCY